ncbi:MAG TPA: NBR1-Ig-like domain-containing protein, partial [Candidatus Nanoarchaeia archaeon]|nr:NBR1-Ig-like domain-containing protein [Candidatus Nanoarchaeia archaeon]
MKKLYLASVLFFLMLSSAVFADFVQIQNAASCNGGGWCTGTPGDTLNIRGCQRIEAGNRPYDNELQEGFVQFDTSSLPDAFTLNSLTLRIYCRWVVGPKPNEWPTTTATSLNLDSITPYIPGTGTCQWNILKPKVGTMLCNSKGYKDFALDKNNAIINPNGVSAFRIWRYPELTSYYYMSATTTGGDAGGYSAYLLIDYSLDNAECVSNTIPSTMVAGSTRTVSVTMKNTGASTWTDAASYRLGSQDPQDNTRWGVGRDRVSANVAPGQQHTFSFDITAPSTPGTYSSRWKMLQENVRWFGQTCGPTAVIVVQNTPPVLSGIPDKTIPARSGLNDNLVDLYQHASDAQDPDTALTFTITSQSDTSGVICSVDANRYIDCTAPTLPGPNPQPDCENTFSDIAVQVSDPQGLTATDTFRVNVDLSNGPDADGDGVNDYCDKCPSTLTTCEELNPKNGCPNCDNPTCLDDPSCICSSCNDCGVGFWNLCDYTECTTMCAGQPCFFVDTVPNTCASCSDATGCSSYNNEQACSGDTCSLGCYWNSSLSECLVSECRDGYIDPTEECDFNSIDTVGVYRPSELRFYLRNSNTAGPVDITVNFGATGAIPVVGDWNGDGVVTVGFFVPSEGAFYLKINNLNTRESQEPIYFGQLGDIPLAGDWDGDGDDTIGVYRPSTSEFYLKINNLNTEELTVGFVYGVAGDKPIVGDWDGDGIDTVGVRHGINFRLRNSNTAGNPDVTVDFGNVDDVPIVGDWNGDGIDTIGVYRPSDSTFRLRNSNTAGLSDIVLVYGTAGDIPVVGDWDGIGDTIFGDTDTCQELDFDVGTLKCNTQTCAFDTSGCRDIACGDGYVDSPEQCDFDALGAGIFGIVDSCADAGYYSGILACYGTCTLNTTGCNSFCGNGILEANEECDGTNLRGLSCNDFDTFTGGTLKCDACGLNTTFCIRTATCGDGIIDPAEQCDFNTLTGNAIYGAGSDQCTDFDTYLGGTLSCIPADYENECQINISLCTGITPGACGNGVINLGEQCDGTQLGGLACSDFDRFNGGALACSLDCFANTSRCTRASACGDGIIDANEECETVNNIPIFGDGSNSCTDLGFDYGALGCNDCGLNISTCRYCTGLADDCCSIGPGCDPDCTAIADPDCTNCLPTPGNCCNDLGNNGCDTDCPAGKDPDCSTACLPTADNCCDDTNNTPNQCDPDCDSGVDPDCAPCTPMPGDCCSEIPDYICDTDCVPLIDPDCLGCENTPDDCCLPLNDTVCDVNCQQDYDPDCGNCTPIAGDCCDPDDDLICDEDCPRGADPVDPNCPPEVCDVGETLCSTGDCCYDCYTCDTGFAPCDFDSLCEVGEGCTCADCSNEQDSCLDDLVCDYNAGICTNGPPCPVGTRLCDDGTCKSDCGENNLGCLTTAEGGTNACDLGESCDCDDCNNQQDNCASGLKCDYGSGLCVDGPKCPPGTTLCSDQTCKADCTTYPACNLNVVCDAGEGCDCADCAWKNDTCIYGAFCNPNLDVCTKPCSDGTTLCADGKCCSDCNNCGGNLPCSGGAPNGVCEQGESCNCVDCDGSQDNCVENSLCYYPLKTCISEDCLAQGSNPDANSCLCNIIGMVGFGVNAGLCNLHNETFCYSASYSGTSQYAKCCGDDNALDSWVVFESGTDLEDVLPEDTCINGRWYRRQNAGV